MNNTVITGTIETTPTYEVLFSRNGGSIDCLSYTIASYCTSRKGILYATQISCKSFGKVAVDMKNKLSKGMELTIKGHLCPEYDSREKPALYLNVTDYEFPELTEQN